MAERTLPGIGLTGFYDLGVPYKDQMDTNLRLLSALVQCSVISRVTVLPTTPVLGDIYIVPSDDASNPNQIAVWDGEVGAEAWVYISPLEGWQAYVRDTDETVTYDGSAWMVSGGGGSASYPSFTSNAGRVLAVNAGEDGVEWVEDQTSGGSVTVPAVPPDYANEGGQGNRSSIINVTANFVPDVGAIENLVDGSLTDNSSSSWWWGHSDVTGDAIVFQFAEPRTIEEATWLQGNSTSHGIFKWQGSPDGTAWSDLSSNFTLGGSTSQVQVFDLWDGTTAYTYFRIIGVSGSHSNGPWVREAEFKIGTPAKSIPDGSSQSMTQSEITSSYTATESDFSAREVKKANLSVDGSITIPPGILATEPLTVIQTGTGKVTLNAGPGVAINAADGNLSIAGRYHSVTIVPDLAVSNTYYLIGARVA